MMLFLSELINFINRLSELGQQVGSRMLDILVLREKGMKREVRVLNILLFIKSVLWRVRLSNICEVNFDICIVMAYNLSTVIK